MSLERSPSALNYQLLHALARFIFSLEPLFQLNHLKLQMPNAEWCTMVSQGGCLSTILSRILNICHFSLEINHRSQFHNLARWRQGGSVWGLLFSLDWSCLWTLRWFWVTLMEILEWKKTRQWWGPKLVRLWHMISYLYVLLYKEPALVPLGHVYSLKIYEPFYSQQTHPIIHSGRPVSGTPATWINVPCDSHPRFFSHEQSTSPVDNTRVKCFQK